MKNKRTTVLGLAVLAVMLLTACSGVSSMLNNQAENLLPAAAQAQEPVEPMDEPSTAAQVEPGLLASYQATLEEIYQRVNPQVVNIRVLVGQPIIDSSSQEMPQFPDSQPYGQGMGSGFIWDQDGHIVTNNHVVAEATEIEVTFADGTTLPAELVGADPYSDLAVVKVQAPADLLRPVEIADSRQVKVGQLAIAIGNPFGLDGTMTVGIVSALGRSLPTGEGLSTGPTYSIPEIIQTDAPINPGNSGGVLVDDLGQVIGVTAAIESTSGANAGIGFVIPSAIVQKVVPGLISAGHYDHPYLGISGTSLTPDLAQAMGLESNQRGALISEITPGGPADQAGLRGSEQSVEIDGQSVNVGGDVVTSIDGQPIQEIDDLIAYLVTNTSVGQKVTMSVLRDGENVDVDVVLGARPSMQETSQQSQLQPQQQPSNPSASGAWLGIYGLPMDAELAKAMNLADDQQGVLVVQVTPGSPAEQAGLRGGNQPYDMAGEQIMVGGDVITAIDGQSVATLEALRSYIQEQGPGTEVTLTILRGGETMEVPATLAEMPTELP